MRFAHLSYFPFREGAVYNVVCIASNHCANMEALAMLEAAILLVAIAAVIVSALVPFLSVYVAQCLVRRDAFRESVRDAFFGVSRHIQEYRIAFLEHYMNVEQESAGVRQSAATLQEMVTVLNGDCLYLGLLFDEKADPLGSRVQQLAGTAQLLFAGSGPPTLDKCQEGLKRDIQVISQEMKTLWDSLK